MIETQNICRALSEIDTNALFFVDTEGVIRNINKGVTTILGYSADEIVGKGVESLFPPNIRGLHKSIFVNYVKSRKNEENPASKIIGSQRVFPATIAVQDNEPKRFSILKSDQQELPITLTINEAWSDNHDLIGFIAIIRDNTEQHSLLQTLQSRATHDQLTGLLNFQEFMLKIREVKKHMLEKGIEDHASILFLDIDYFKTITYYSNRTGDYAIQKVAHWLLNNTRQKNGRESDSLICRLIGDEFILYLPGSPLDAALALSRRIKSEFLELNLRTTEAPFFSSISIGVAEVSPTTDLRETITRAESACQIAKGKGKDKIEVAQEDGDHFYKLEPLIREALQSQRLELYAQKIVAISPSAKSIDKGMAHYEVLIRMADNNGNIISPMIFIPAVEKIGLAVAIDQWVIEHTLAFLQNNHAHEESLSLCSIDLSGISASNERMVTFIESQIFKSGVDPRKLCFEVTETSEIQDNAAALALVSKLKGMGCKIAFDDFGIGFSNYQSFSRLPVDIIKIDGSYIRHILDDSQLRIDVEGMINSAKARGLEIVAEYAENEEIVAALKLLGVDYAQGYHFSKPEPLTS